MFTFASYFPRLNSQIHEWNQVGKEAIPLINTAINAERQTFILYLKPGRYRAFVFNTYETALFDRELEVH